MSTSLRIKGQGELQRIKNQRQDGKKKSSRKTQWIVNQRELKFWENWTYPLDSVAIFQGLHEEQRKEKKKEGWMLKC